MQGDFGAGAETAGTAGHSEDFVQEDPDQEPWEEEDEGDGDRDCDEPGILVVGRVFWTAIEAGCRVQESFLVCSRGTERDGLV